MPMRWLMLAMLFSAHAYAQDVSQSSPQTKEQAKRSANVKQETNRKEPISVELPSPLNVTVSGQLDMKGTNDRAKQHEQFYASPEFWVAAFTGLLVAVTGWLVFYTKNLWAATVNLARDSKATSDRQARETKESLRIAEISANAARDAADIAARVAMPFLLPHVTKFGLYPEGEPKAVIPRPSVVVAFENIGRSPAILRQVGCKLLLVQRDQLPEVPESIEGFIERNSVIAPAATGEAKEWKFERDISQNDVDVLRARATKGQEWARFYVYGYAIYDDVFDVRHTKHFCMKVRQNGFQQQRGGEVYNRLEREKAPKNVSPLEPTEDESA